MHRMDQLIDLVKASELVSNILVNGQLADKNLVHKLWNILARLPTTKGGTFPDATSYELEGPGGKFLSSSSHSDDCGLTISAASTL